MAAGLLGLLYVVLAAYLPLSRLLPRGRSFATRADLVIPLVPYLGPVYVLGMFPIALLPIIFWSQLTATTFRAYALATIGGALVSYIVYFVWPSEIRRAELPEASVARFCLGLAYASRSPRGVFPSGHALYTALNCRVLLEILEPRWWPAAIAAAILIISAALLTRLHYVLDIVAGLAMALIGLALVGLLG